MPLPEKYKSPYNATSTEGTIYEKELASGFFTPENLVKAYPERYEESEAWTTITPPPNANGRLHVGHALDVTLKDIIGRFKRMQGKRVLMLPGSDHAGFEKQVVYEKKLEKEVSDMVMSGVEKVLKENLSQTEKEKIILKSLNSFEFKS